MKMHPKFHKLNLCALLYSVAQCSVYTYSLKKNHRNIHLVGNIRSSIMALAGRLNQA